MNATEDLMKQKLHASFLSADEAGVWMQGHKHDLRHQSLSHTSTVCHHGISPDQTCYLVEDEIDQGGWRQSGRLTACSGLDMAHIKGRREEAGGAFPGSQI